MYATEKSKPACQNFVENIKLKHNERLISFDAGALHPFIPFKECVDIIGQKMQRQPHLECHYRINRFMPYFKFYLICNTMCKTQVL